MKITSFFAEGVNDYMDFNIKFRNDINFLVGINGAGKTTAINLILGLLSPSWINLTQIKYKNASIQCLKDNVLITIKSENIDEGKLRLSIIKENEENIISSVVRIQELPNIFEDSISRIELRQAISRQNRFENHFNELDAVQEIRNLITPNFLGLDRRIHKGEEIDLLKLDGFSRDRDFSDEFKDNLYKSLQDVEELIKNSYLKYTEKQSEVGNELKNKIIYSSFDLIENKEGFNISNQSNIDIETRKQRIIDASKNFEIPDLESKIVFYFDELKKIKAKLDSLNDKRSNKASKEFMHVVEDWFVNSPQLKRIDNIISLYEEAQTEITEEYKQFQQFELLTNQYFSESQKEISIKKNGVIGIKLPNKKDSSIYKLSSGEKQILVMLAQLIFGKKKEIFIIDEPELSLHLAWQELFVESIVKASPETQFILATHSPMIVGPVENEKYCIQLMAN